MQYLASNGDLINAFGSNITAATHHYITDGHSEGRSHDSFNVDLYLANYSDLAAAFGDNTTAATRVAYLASTIRCTIKITIKTR